MALTRTPSPPSVIVTFFIYSSEVSPKSAEVASSPARSAPGTRLQRKVLTDNNYHILLDQTLLSISRRSQIVAAPPDVLNEIVALSNTIAAANSRVAHAAREQTSGSNGNIK